MKKLILFIFLIPLLATLCLAKVTTQTSASTSGLEIGVNLLEYHLLNNSLEFYLHVFNISDGMPLTSNINCSLHIYDTNGSHAYKSSTTTLEHNYDFKFVVPNTVFSDIGKYQYMAQCTANNAAGGFYSQTFYVVKAGYDLVYNKSENGFVAMAWFLRIMAILGFLLLCWFVLAKYNELIEKGKKIKGRGLEPLDKV